MQKFECVGARGIAGWAISAEDSEAYFQHIQSHWNFLQEIWHWFRPSRSNKVIAWSRPDGGVSITTPTPWMIHLLMRGDVVRNMRQVDTFGSQGLPVFEGTGELMPPMTEDEALRFIVWKDIPRGINHFAFVDKTELPRSRARRNDWRLSANGKIVEA